MVQVSKHHIFLVKRRNRFVLICTRALLSALVRVSSWTILTLPNAALPTIPVGGCGSFILSSINCSDLVVFRGAETRPMSLCQPKKTHLRERAIDGEREGGTTWPTGSCEDKPIIELHLLNSFRINCEGHQKTKWTHPNQLKRLPIAF